MLPLLKLREAIARVLSSEVKAYDLAEVCVKLGLRPAEDVTAPWSSKRLYVLKRIKEMDLGSLLDLAENVIEEYGQDEYLRPVMRQFMVPGVDGEAKNLIFAANGPKPEIVLADAINNQIQIVANGEYCLVFDLPIPKTGLTWADLVAWWQQRGAPPSEPEQAERSLYRRLSASLDSAPEKLLFKTYFANFRPVFGGNLPALIPQVYLHYDPYTLKQLGGQGRLKRQRMDFLLLLEHRHRVVLEVDGKQHYSSADGLASPSLYAEMVSEDRQLRLAGYEVYRFGGAELQGEAGRTLIKDFFQQLLERYATKLAPENLETPENLELPF